MSEKYKDMESEQNKQFGLKTGVVAVLCLLGAGAGSYYLYEDFNQSGGAGRGKPMAKVERHEAKVRRKAASSFAWNNVRSDENLFKRDSVQTSVGSAAAIRFNDGTMLELGENSLVVIDEITNLSLDFLKGSIVLHTAQGDKRVTVDKDGKAKFEELPIRLIKPEILARFFTREREAKQIHFVWKPRDAQPGKESGLPASYSLQVSPDKNFRGTRVQTLPITDGKQLETDVQLGAGNYFWRLVAGEKVLTESAQFRVVPASALKPLSPGAGEKLLSYGDQPPVQFRWVEQDEGALTSNGEHLLQISRDPDFKKVIAEQTVSPTSGLATVKDLPDADLYWRIKGKYADIEVLSAVERFTIGKAIRPQLSLIQPEDKKTLELAAQLAFGWRSDIDGLQYQFEIESSQGKKIVTERSGSTSYIWKKFEAGAYRWRVSAFHKDHSVGETVWRTFSVFEGARIALRAPERDQQILYWEKPLPFTFKWDVDVLAARHADYSYQVVAARNADFKEPIFGAKTREPSLSSDKIKLSTGNYFWKVLVVDAAGQTIKSSEPFQFAYNVYPILNPPEPLTPAPAAVFNLVEADKNPVVSWAAVKDAEAYEVMLYAAEPARATASGKPPAPVAPKLVSQFVTNRTSNEFKKLKPAEYTWTVRAIDRIKRKGNPMPSRPFTITYGEVLQSPEVTTPEVQ